jgi:hypothetical protein
MPERLLVLRQEAQLLQVQQAQVQLELLAQPGALLPVRPLVLAQQQERTVRMHRQMNR